MSEQSRILELIGSAKPFTDVHIMQDHGVNVRMPSGWNRLDEPPVTYDEMFAFLNAIDTDWENRIKQGAINRPYDTKLWRFRINAFLASSRLTLSIRRIPAQPPSMKEIGLPATASVMLESPRGLILVSGSTGSGKSTTIAAIVRSLNETHSAHIITIEDPVEYVYTPQRAFFSQREIGTDVASYDIGVEDAMRQRPDVIVIGEIRDAKTAAAALRAGESGHLVIATLHANSASGTISKLMSFFETADADSKRQVLAGSLLGVINQILLPRSDDSGYALAAELMFNHKRQVSEMLTQMQNIDDFVNRRADGLSRGMVDAMYELVKSGVVAKGTALRALSHGQAALNDRLKST